MKLAMILLAAATACGSSSNPGSPDGHGGGGVDGNGSGSGSNNPGHDGGLQTDGNTAVTRTIFVIPMENESSSNIYGNTQFAPYINNTLIPMGAKATNFQDELPSSIPSEPHYVWMEAGTNTFSDHTFTTDNDASTSNSTSNTEPPRHPAQGRGRVVDELPGGHDGGHVPGQLDRQRLLRREARSVRLLPGRVGRDAEREQRVLRRASQAATPPSQPTSPPATCPPTSSSRRTSATTCTARSAARRRARNGDIQAGDTWLRTSCRASSPTRTRTTASSILTWDEGSSTSSTAFIAFGPHIKPGPDRDRVHPQLARSSRSRSILRVTLPSVVTSANDFADMFETGYFQ